MLLSTFGLAYRDYSMLIDIIRSTAIDVLTTLLHKDMAYSRELMEQMKSKTIAVDFFSLFQEKGSHYYTNGRWDQRERTNSWIPMTESTFDGGIVVQADRISGCIWFEEED